MAGLGGTLRIDIPDNIKEKHILSVRRELEGDESGHWAAIEINYLKRHYSGPELDLIFRVAEDFAYLTYGGNLIESFNRRYLKN